MCYRGGTREICGQEKLQAIGKRGRDMAKGQKPKRQGDNPRTPGTAQKRLMGEDKSKASAGGGQQNISGNYLRKVK